MKWNSLAVAVAIVLLAILPAQALADEGESSVILGGRKAPTTILTWEVQFGILKYGQYWDTRWYAESDLLTSVYAVTYFRPGMLPVGMQFPIGPEGRERWLSGDPSYLWYATGFQLAPAAGQNSFAGIRWSAYECGLPGPKFQMTRQGEKNTIVVTNTTSKVLFLSVNGKHERKLDPGQVFTKVFPHGGEIKLSATKGGMEAAAIWVR